jgi:dihydrofolate reductase
MGRPAQRKMRKYVFSSKLSAAEWSNCTVVRGDPVSEVKKLKEQEGRDLLIFGHGMFGQTLLKEQLLDRIDLSIHPRLARHSNRNGVPSQRGSWP